ncbi:hypothetical protein NHJ6243_009666 [Beauveria neobassiana]
MKFSRQAIHHTIKTKEIAVIASLKNVAFPEVLVGHMLVAESNREKLGEVVLKVECFATEYARSIKDPKFYP